MLPPTAVMQGTLSLGTRTVCVSGCMHVNFDMGLDGDRFTAASAGHQKNCRCGALQLEASSNEGVFSGSRSAFSRQQDL